MAESTPIELNVNGAPHRLEVDPTTPLLFVLRNDLGLLSPKLGCGLEQCGACTVLVGGEALQTCRLPVGEVGEREVVTLEGLEEDGRLHPLQQAFHDALLSVFPLFQRAWWAEAPAWSARYVRRFGHLCEGEAEGRTGVQELGVWRPGPVEAAPGRLASVAFQGGSPDAWRAALSKLGPDLARR